ncbi:mfsd4b [Symbiodinium natans]|uniref:Mfsd4b protein n=1 Tax=Symbiodinium natans TaxID=878477 RepID=A0A812G055_9DINO|nr:mfsd4b [Symbiodinium natans]
MLTVWRGSKYVNAAVHGFHFLFGLGAFVAPLCVGLALSEGRPAVEAWYSPSAGFLPAMLTLGLLVSHAQPSTKSEEGETSGLPKVVLWTGAFLLSYVGLEVAFGGYVDAFAVRHLHVSKVAAANLTSLYWAALSAARLVATLVTPYVNHYRYIQLHLLGAFASMAAFAQSSWRPGTGLSGEVVLCTFLYGFSLGPLFPGALLVAEEKLHPEPLGGRAAGFTVACAALGEMILPLLTGLCFDIEVTSFAFVQRLGGSWRFWGQEVRQNGPPRAGSGDPYNPLSPKPLITNR